MSDVEKCAMTNERLAEAKKITDHGELLQLVPELIEELEKARALLKRLEELIPKNTPYCYTQLAPVDEKTGVMRVRNCPYYSSDNDTERCLFDPENVNNEIDDQCKICGISEGY